MTKRCPVVGLLPDPSPLHPLALRRLKEATLVIGSQEQLTQAAPWLAPKARRYDLLGRLQSVPEVIEAAWKKGETPLVLATGDPFCQGIGAYLASRLGAQNLEIFPHLSVIQLAAAQIGLAWQGVKVVSLHCADLGEWAWGADPRNGLYPLRQALAGPGPWAVFTGPANGPDKVARLLEREGIADEFALHLFERLQYPDERARLHLSAFELSQGPFLEPNLLWLTRLTPPASPQLFGLADQAYQTRKPEKGLITKREVRCLALGLLELTEETWLWDIGAGSGSVGLEAARICTKGHVWAMEKNAEDYAIALKNRQAMRVFNYSLFHCKAPEGLETWPDPDAVFIGGSGGELRGLIQLVLRRLKPQGRLALTFVTLENLALAQAELKAWGGDWGMIQSQASRSQPILKMHRFAAEHPVWLLWAKKGEA